jgi:hypothetical protein
VSGDIKAAHQELTGRVMALSGVSGTAIGMSGGKPCLMVYLSEKGAGKSVPSSVQGFPVVTEVTGSFRRL